MEGTIARWGAAGVAAAGTQSWLLSRLIDGSTARRPQLRNLTVRATRQLSAGFPVRIIGHACHLASRMGDGGHVVERVISVDVAPPQGVGLVLVLLPRASQVLSCCVPFGAVMEVTSCVVGSYV